MVFVGNARRIEELLKDEVSASSVFPVEKSDKLERLEDAFISEPNPVLESVTENTHYLVSVQYGSANVAAAYSSYEPVSYNASDSTAYEVAHEAQVKQEAQDVAQSAKDDHSANRVTVLIDESAISRRNAIKDSDPITWFLMNEPSFSVKLGYR